MKNASLIQELGELKAVVETLELKGYELDKEIKVQPDKDERLAQRAELTALRNQIAALRNQITELQKEKNILLGQSQGRSSFSLR